MRQNYWTKILKLKMITKSKFKQLVLALLMSLSFTSLAHAQLDTKKLESEMKSLVRSSEFLEGVLNQQQLRGNARIAYRETLSEIYGNDEVISAVVKEITNLMPPQKELPSDFWRKFGSEYFISLGMRGLARLSPESQRTVINFTVSLMSKMTPNECKQLLVPSRTSGGSVTSNIESKYYEKFPLEELRTYTSTLRDAVFAEVRNFPAVRTLSAQQASIGDTFLKAEIAKIQKSGTVRSEVWLAMSDMANSDPQHVCEAGKILLSTISSSNSYAGELMLLKYIQSVRR